MIIYLRNITCIILFFISCKEEKKLFDLISGDESGIEFENTINEFDSINIFNNIYVYNGGGVAIGDVNNDGLQDLFFTGNQVDNKLYLNKGNLQFQDITLLAKVNKDKGQWSMSANFVDINNDGKMDIYVCNAIYPDTIRRKNLLYINEGNNDKGIPTFSEQAQSYGLDHASHSNNIQFFDYDQDGDLDLYIAVNSSIRNLENQFILHSRKLVQANTDHLLENIWDEKLQHGRFMDVSQDKGIVWEGYSNSCLITDINGDTKPDIYVGNDFLSNDIWYVNQAKDSSFFFENRVKEIFKHQSYSAMGADMADVNNDGWMDFITTEMLPYDNRRKKTMLNANNYTYYINTEKFNYGYQYIRNTLQINQGLDPSGHQMIFSDLGIMAGVYQTDWSWAPLFADFDNDGHKDLFISTGFLRDINDHDWGSYRSSIVALSKSQEAMIKSIPQVKIPNFAYKNKGQLQFDDVSKAWGLHQNSFSNGSAYGDLDNDGDLDLVVNNINDRAFLYQNNTIGNGNKSSHHFIRIALQGHDQNRSAYGSNVTIYYDQFKKQTAQLLSSRGYLSQSESMLHFGLGNCAKIDSAVILWANGQKTVVYDLIIDQANLIKYEDENKRSGLPGRTNITALFEPINSEAIGLNYKHDAVDFSDFNIQRTLPHKLSQYSPALSVGDLNGDGLDDVFICNSTQPDVIYYQQKNGKFEQKWMPNDASKKSNKHAGVVIFDADGDGDNDIYTTVGGYNSQTELDEMWVNKGKGKFELSKEALPIPKSNTSTIKAADYDQDGDLDLFIGSRVLLGQYPKADKSYILRNDTKEKDKIIFTDVTAQVYPSMDSIGMVSDALWSDFNNDHFPDLVIACEWKPLTFLKNTGNGFENVTEATGIHDKVGWWNSLSAADFDQDGDVDYVAGNLGTNTFFQGNQAQPMTIYANDFDKNGKYDCFISMFMYDAGGQKRDYLFNTRDDIIGQWPGLHKRYNSYAEFGNTTTEKIFTNQDLQGAIIMQANWMYTSFIENLGNGKFAIKALPMQTQIAPVFATLPFDVDDNGLVDIILVGNDYGMEILQGHADAFNGLVLKNFGKNDFRPMGIQESGFYVPHDAKALSYLILNDEKAMILATQNKDSLRVFSPTNVTGEWIKCLPAECRADIYFNSGKIERRELSWGQSFLSQHARSLQKLPSMDKIIFYNSTGKVTRTIE
ncbi:MAG TPA: VCBS repeat-containing protein [Saprospiraceae bacterium]|nr:VCBS repeat-containing protein [Saprospiraceae bacterium]